MTNTVQINVLANVAKATAGLEAVNQKLNRLDKQSKKTGFRDFVKNTRDLAVAHLAVNALAKGFPDLSFGIEGATRKVTALSGAFTAAVGAAAPLLALGAGLGAAFFSAGAGIGAVAVLAGPTFKGLFDGVTAATKAQDAYNAALASGDKEGAKKALEDRTAALALLTPAQREAALATLSFKDALKKQSEAFSTPLLGAYTQGMETLKGLLPQIVAVATPARDALLGIFDRLDAAVKSPAFAEFVKVLSGSVGPAITSLGDIAFSFGSILKNVFVAAAPFIQNSLDLVSGLVKQLADASAGQGLFNFFKQMQPLLPLIGGLISSVVKTVGSLITAALPLAGPVLGAVKALSDALGKLFKSKDFATFVTNISSIVTQLSPVFDVLVDVIGRVFAALSGQLADILPVLIPVIEDFANVFADVLVGLSPLLPSIIELVGALVTGLLPVIGSLVPLIRTSFIPLVQSLIAIVPQLIPSFVALVTAITPLLPQIVSLLAAIVPLIPPLLQLAVAILDLAISSILPLLPPLTKFITLIGTALSAAVTFVLPYVKLISDKITEFGGVWGLIGEGIKNTITKVKDAITVFVTLAVLQFELMRAGAQAKFDQIKTAISTAITGAIDFVKAKLNDAKTFMSTTWDSIKTKTTDTWNAVKKAVSDRITDVINKVKEIKGKVQDALSNAATFLKDAGRRIIDGLISGIESGFDRVQSLLNRLTAMIPDWKGPAKRDSKLLTNAGQLIMQSLVDGLDKGETGVMRQLAGTTRSIARAFDNTSANITPSISLGSSSFGTGSSSAGGDTYVIQVTAAPGVDYVAFAKEIQKALSAGNKAGVRITV